ncbi:hypothetical protein EV198_2471 [Roseivirga ehrenbergii]|uniref:IrrE N-terminal-like domain-containing protein n=1 Tax=Roseivirga ehrenbergii (strain DSM 102268 / JCM 13514 / KCTC 12282 / NCIMB 14502 / KMM 6017) TaxID=279360 RepID=A0A150XSX5_ROSEK|nr:hypothetical protein [Roseivirga ehrenbergii]KYG81869.1 hypothetical protein MB14_00305 [Roseivirga ehrenbergii]TCL01683.1 hypothetical protein EV198_2471 [Roseivirga ehrenbergii]
MLDNTHLINTITKFLEQIGIAIQYTPIQESTFLPGIKIDKGVLFIDQDQLKYPGDLLHEAGHIAVMTPEERTEISGNIMEHKPDNESDEMAAILWSYAALKHLNLVPQIVFHPEGYKNDSEWLIKNFENGQYIGLPLLEWMGLTDSDSFPKMKYWLRQ